MSSICNMRVEFGDEILECPICLDELDITDRSFKPCKCGYQMCRFCWNHINENLNGRCPACRQPYKTENYKFTPPNPEEIQRMQNEKKAKERERKHAEANARKQLANVRVVQRNLVYVTNLALSAGEDTLRRMDYFGRFGKIKKVVVNRNNVYQGQQGPSVSAYITYVNYKDASDAIKAMDGTMLEGRLLRASFGTTKYCSYFLRNVRCPNPECMYLHEQGNHVEILKGNQVDAFIKEDSTKGRPSAKEWTQSGHLYNGGTMEEEENGYQGNGLGRSRDLLRSQTGGRTNNQNVAWKNSSAPVHQVHHPGTVGSGSVNPEEWPDALVTHDGQSQARRCNLPPTQQQQQQQQQQYKERNEFFTEFETAQIKSALPATASWASKATANAEEDDRDHQKRNVQSNPTKSAICLSQSDRGKRTKYESGEVHGPPETDPTKPKNQTNTKKNTELARPTQNKPQPNTNGNIKLSQKGQRKQCLSREELGELTGGEEFGEENCEEDISKTSPKGAKGRVPQQSLRSLQDPQSPSSLNESQFLPRDGGESLVEKNGFDWNGTDGKTTEERKNGKIMEERKNGKIIENWKNDDKKTGKTTEDKKNGKTTEDKKNGNPPEDKKNGKPTEDKKNGKTPPEDKKNGNTPEDKKNGKTITEDGKNGKTSKDGKNGNMMVYDTHVELQTNNGIKSEVTKEIKDTETQSNKDGTKPEPPGTEAGTALPETVKGVESRLDSSNPLHSPVVDMVYTKDLQPMAVNTVFSQNHCPGYAIGEWSQDASSHIPPGFEHLHGNDFLQHVEPDLPSEYQGLEDWLRMKFTDLFSDGPSENLTEISNPSWNNELLFPCGNTVTASRFAFARDDGGFMRDEPKEGYQDPHQECFLFPSVHTHPPVGGTGEPSSYPVVLGSPNSIPQGEFGGGLNGEGWSSQSQGSSQGVPPATQVLQTQLLQVQILQNHLMHPSSPQHTELLSPPPQPMLQSHFQSLHGLAQESSQVPVMTQGGQDQVQTQRQSQNQGQVQRQTQNQGQTQRQTQVQAYVQAQTQTQSLQAGKQRHQRHQQSQQKQLAGPWSQGYSNFGGCLDPMWGHAQVGPEVYRDIGIAQAYPNNLLMVMQPHPPLQVQPQLRHPLPQPIPPQWATNVQQQNMYWAHPPVMRGIPSGALHQPTPIQQVVPPPGL